MTGTSGTAAPADRDDVGPVPALTVVRGSVPGGPDAASAGTMASALAQLHDAVSRALSAPVAGGHGGGVLMVVETDEPRSQSAVCLAVTAMCRSFAREYAGRAVRVNAVLTAGAAPSELLEFVAGPAAGLVTGAVFDAR